VVGWIDRLDKEQQQREEMEELLNYQHTSMFLRTVKGVEKKVSDFE